MLLFITLQFPLRGDQAPGVPTRPYTTDRRGRSCFRLDFSRLSHRSCRFWGRQVRISWQGTLPTSEQTSDDVDDHKPSTSQSVPSMLLQECNMISINSVRVKIHSTIQQNMSSRTEIKFGPPPEHFHGSLALSPDGLLKTFVPWLKIQGTVRDQNMDPTKTRAKTNNMTSNKPRDPKNMYRRAEAAKAHNGRCCLKQKASGCSRSRSWFQDAPG